MALMTMLSPFMIWVGTLDSISTSIRTDTIAWSTPVVAVLAGELLLTLLVLGVTCWRQVRRSVPLHT